MRLKLVSLILAALCSGGLGEADVHAKFEKLKEWVIANGGLVKCKIGDNANGIRGLVVSEDVPSGGYIASIPASTILNAGSSTSSFLTTILSFMREYRDPNSRFRPYMDLMPGPDEVLNACNLPDKYLPLLTQYMRLDVASRTYYLEPALDGSLRDSMEYTIPEMLGSQNVTLDELKHACALTSSRYVSIEPRNRLLLVPIYDLSNHDRDCQTQFTGYADSNLFHILAGADLKAGDEVCNNYGDHMRDDHTFLSYGFLPEEETEPRLLSEDHHLFKNDGTSFSIGDEPFDGNLYESENEKTRLEMILVAILKSEQAENKTASKAPGTERIYDMIMELRRRRRVALNFEINRLTKVIKTMTARRHSSEKRRHSSKEL